MDLKFSGKVALVTGSSKGLGKSIATTLHEEGCNVIMNGRNYTELAKAATDISASYVVGDISDKKEAQAVIERANAIHQRLDIIVCNVGSGASLAPGEEDESEWQRMLKINLMSATNVVDAARPFLKVHGGVILCISSICGIAALGAPIAYSASKAALNSFVRGAAQYLAKENIRINALAPGNIMFPGSTWEKKLAVSPDNVAAMLANDVALGRFGTVHEVAAMAAFLCSSQSGFATGGVFVLDGGQLRG